MLFGLLPMRAEGGMIATVCILLVLFDCLMTFCGSTANDAAFNAWVADVTTPENRGLVNGVLSTLPVFAVVLPFLSGIMQVTRSHSRHGPTFAMRQAERYGFGIIRERI